eukprot:TRINITY_DN1217_c0_g1_i1.p1 TRINITY_DN1217_c0_g1~~TRINITY_DN1217_c0_g1_i1.p1  ORF type:complete len:326 (-),score=65.91 TRINITY_DN1217_c0_g1_i1:3-980(-)
MRLLVQLLFLSAFTVANGDKFIESFTWGSFNLTVINDLSGEGSNAEFFIDGPFGPPIPFSILGPGLQRMGYNYTETTFGAAINVVYGQTLDSNGNLVQFLIDTGLGYFAKGASRLVSALETIGVTPDMIDFIFLTHGHPDHSGGLLDVNENIVFKKAVLVMGRGEFELWTSPNPNWGDFCCPAELTADLPPVTLGLKYYQQAEQIVLLDDLKTLFTSIPSVTLMLSGGHVTSSHMTVSLDLGWDGSDRVYVLGDSFCSGLHMENLNWGNTHDHHRNESITTRQIYTELVFRDNDVLIGMHFAFPGCGNFQSDIKQFFPSDKCSSQ